MPREVDIRNEEDRFSTRRYYQLGLGMCRYMELVSPELENERSDQLYCNLQSAILGAHTEKTEHNMEDWDLLNLTLQQQQTPSLKNMIAK